MKWKPNTLVALLLLSIRTFGQINDSANTYQDFKLDFFSIGFGSNMYSKQPVFKVYGNRFTYTRSSAWTSNNITLNDKIDTISFGVFRESSIDSILSQITDLDDTLIFKSNPEIMSGGVDILEIWYGSKLIRYELNNAYDTTVGQIVTILNAYIPNEKDYIWIMPEY